MPDTPLTEILKDFRKYRPGNHKDFLEWVQIAANGPSGQKGVMDFALEDKHSACKFESRRHKISSPMKNTKAKFFIPYSFIPSLT